MRFIEIPALITEDIEVPNIVDITEDITASISGTTLTINGDSKVSGEATITLTGDVTVSTVTTSNIRQPSIHKIIIKTNGAGNFTYVPNNTVTASSVSTTTKTGSDLDILLITTSGGDTYLDLDVADYVSPAANFSNVVTGFNITELTSTYGATAKLYKPDGTLLTTVNSETMGSGVNFGYTETDPGDVIYKLEVTDDLGRKSTYNLPRKWINYAMSPPGFEKLELAGNEYTSTVTLPSLGSSSTAKVYRTTDHGYMGIKFKIQGRNAPSDDWVDIANADENDEVLAFGDYTYQRVWVKPTAKATTTVSSSNVVTLTLSNLTEENVTTSFTGADPFDINETTNVYVFEETTKVGTVPYTVTVGTETYTNAVTATTEEVSTVPNTDMTAAGPNKLHDIQLSQTGGYMSEASGNGKYIAYNKTNDSVVYILKGDPVSGYTDYTTITYSQVTNAYLVGSMTYDGKYIIIARARSNSYHYEIWKHDDSAETYTKLSQTVQTIGTSSDVNKPAFVPAEGNYNFAISGGNSNNGQDFSVQLYKHSAGTDTWTAQTIISNPRPGSVQGTVSNRSMHAKSFTKDGKYLMFGNTSTYGGYDVFNVDFDENTVTHAGNWVNNGDIGHSGSITSDGKYILLFDDDSNSRKVFKNNDAGDWSSSTDVTSDFTFADADNDQGHDICFFGDNSEYFVSTGASGGAVRVYRWYPKKEVTLAFANPTLTLTGQNVTISSAKLYKDDVLFHTYGTESKVALRTDQTGTYQAIVNDVYYSNRITPDFTTTEIVAPTATTISTVAGTWNGSYEYRLDTSQTTDSAIFYELYNIGGSAADNRHGLEFRKETDGSTKVYAETASNSLHPYTISINSNTPTASVTISGQVGQVLKGFNGSTLNFEFTITSEHLWVVPPKFSFDGYNKLTFENITSPTSTTLGLPDGTTRDLTTQSNVYIYKPGTYTANVQTSDTFAYLSNVVNNVYYSDIQSPYFTDASTIVTDSNWSSSTGFEITESSVGASQPGYQAFDNTYTAANSYESTWLSAASSGMPAWLQIQYPQDVVIKSYTIVGRDDTDRYYPTSWQLQGATAAAPSTYVNLETTSGNRTASSWAPLAEVSHNVNTPGTAYRYFRLYVNSSNEGGQVSINELKLFTIPLSGQIGVISTPKLTFDGFNKLAIENITQTSSTLKYGSNTYDTNTASNVYVTDAGEYILEAKDANTFVTSNVYVGAVDTQVDYTNLTSMYYGGAVTDVNGVLYTWGHDSYGDSGRGASDRIPTAITTISDPVSNVWRGTPGYTMAAKTSTDKWYMWGRNTYSGVLGNTTNTGNVTVPEDVTAKVTTYFGDQTVSANKIIKMAMGEHHAVALTAGGKVWSWGGDATYYATGTGTNDNTVLVTPVQLNRSPPISGQTGYEITNTNSAVSTLKIRANGSIFTFNSQTCWYYDRLAGSNNTWYTQQLGYVPSTNTFIEASISGNPDQVYHNKTSSNVTKGSITVPPEGILLSNDPGSWNGAALFANPFTSTSDPLMTGITNVEAVYHGTAALDSSGNVWFWGGSNTSMQYAYPTKILDSSSIPGIVGLRATNAGTLFAWKSDGTFYTRGRGSYGQLANGSETDQYTSWQTVTTLQGKTIKKVFGGNENMFVWTNDGVYGVGRGNNYKNGDGSTGNNSVFAKSTTLSALSIKAIDFGHATGLVLTTDGKGYMWGEDASNSMANALSGHQSGAAEATSISALTFSLPLLPTLTFDGYNKLSIDNVSLSPDPFPNTISITYNNLFGSGGGSYCYKLSSSPPSSSTSNFYELYTSPTGTLQGATYGIEFRHESDGTTKLYVNSDDNSAQPATVKTNDTTTSAVDVVLTSNTTEVILENTAGSSYYATFNVTSDMFFKNEPPDTSVTIKKDGAAFATTTSNTVYIRDTGTYTAEVKGLDAYVTEVSKEVTGPISILGEYISEYGTSNYSTYNGANSSGWTTGDWSLRPLRWNRGDRNNSLYVPVPASSSDPFAIDTMFHFYVQSLVANGTSSSGENFPFPTKNGVLWEVDMKNIELSCYNNNARVTGSSLESTYGIGGNSFFVLQCNKNNTNEVTIYIYYSRTSSTGKIFDFWWSINNNNNSVNNSETICLIQNVDLSNDTVLKYGWYKFDKTEGKPEFYLSIGGQTVSETVSFSLNNAYKDFHDETYGGCEVADPVGPYNNNYGGHMGWPFRHFMAGGTRSAVGDNNTHENRNALKRGLIFDMMYFKYNNVFEQGSNSPSLTFDNYNMITLENTNYADTATVSDPNGSIHEIGTAKTMYVKDIGDYVFKISGTDKYVESNVHVSSVDLAGAPTKPIDFDGYNKLTLIDAGSNVSANVTYFSNTYELGSANVLYINGAGTYDLEMSGSNVFALSSNVVGTVTPLPTDYVKIPDIPVDIYNDSSFTRTTTSYTNSIGQTNYIGVKSSFTYNGGDYETSTDSCGDVTNSTQYQPWMVFTSVVGDSTDWYRSYSYYNTANYVNVPSWIKIKIPSAKVAVGFFLKENRNTWISGFTIQGSNNDSDWTDLYTGTTVGMTTGISPTFSNSTAYQYYRLYVTSLSSSGNNYWRIDKWNMHFFGYVAPPSLTFDNYNKLTLENFTTPTLSDVNSANASVTKVSGGGTSPDASSINSHVVLSNGDKAYHYNYTNDTNHVRNLFDNNTSTKAHGTSLSAGEYYEWGYEFASSKKIGSMSFKNWTQGDTVGNISIYYYDGTTWKSVVNPSALGYDLATEPASYAELEITFSPVTATHFKIWVYAHPQSSNSNTPCLSEWTLKSYKDATLTDPNGDTYSLGQTQNDIYIKDQGDYILEVTNSDQSAVVKTNVGTVSQHLTDVVPSLTFDNYNKLSIENLTPTSSRLTYGSNTYEIGTASNVYIEHEGTYKMATGDANTFALVSKEVGTQPLGTTYNLTSLTRVSNYSTANTSKAQVSGNGTWPVSSFMATHNVLNNGDKAYGKTDGGSSRDPAQLFDTISSAWGEASHGSNGTHSPMSWGYEFTNGAKMISKMILYQPPNTHPAGNVTIKYWDGTSMTTVSNQSPTGMTSEVALSSTEFTFDAVSSQYWQIDCYRHATQTTGYTGLSEWEIYGNLITTVTTPSLTYDTSNKLSIENFTPTSTTLTDPNGSSFDIGTATDVYIRDSGTYSIASNDANTFVLTSNTVTGTPTGTTYTHTILTGSHTRISDRDASNTNRTHNSGSSDWPDSNSGITHYQDLSNGDRSYQKTSGGDSRDAAQLFDGVDSGNWGNASHGNVGTHSPMTWGYKFSNGAKQCSQMILVQPPNTHHAGNVTIKYWDGTSMTAVSNQSPLSMDNQTTDNDPTTFTFDAVSSQFWQIDCYRGSDNSTGYTGLHAWEIYDDPYEYVTGTTPSQVYDNTKTITVTNVPSTLPNVVGKIYKGSTAYTIHATEPTSNVIIENTGSYVSVFTTSSTAYLTNAVNVNATPTTTSDDTTIEDEALDVTSTTSVSATAVFHHGLFADSDDPHGDGSITAAAIAGHVYSDTAPGTYTWGTLTSGEFTDFTDTSGGSGNDVYKNGSPPTAGFTTYKWTPPGAITNGRTLVVAGGGGGGMDIGGGGGAGGLLASTTTNIAHAEQTIQVGGGGAKGYDPNDGNRHAGGNGGDSSISGPGITANGGGGGATEHSANNSNPAGNGGSGGGCSGGQQNSGNGSFGGTGTPGQGHDGQYQGNQWWPGGGGGAGEAGHGGGSTQGHGGDGLEDDILGTSYWWAGGGGGAGHSGNAGNGGKGGGGGGGQRAGSYPTPLGDTNGITPGENGETSGSWSSNDGGDGGKHTGGGGGGGHYIHTARGGLGGSGIVAIKFTAQKTVIVPGIPGSTAVPVETTTDTPSAVLDATDTTVTDPILDLDFTTTLPRNLKRYNTITSSSIGARFNRTESKKKRIEKSINTDKFSIELTANNASSPTTLTVTVANSKFVINGDETPTLGFIRGETYTFDQSDASNSEHPLVLVTSEDGATLYETGWTAESRVFTVPYDVPDTIYYKCNVHPNMGGEINTTFGNAFSLGDFTVAANTHVSGEYTLATNYDGTTSNLYVDGALISQTTPTIASGAKTIKIGEDYNGLIKNLKFWNYAKRFFATIIAFHHDTFVNSGDPYSDGSVTAAATAGHIFSDTDTTISYTWGSLDSASTVSNQTTYTWTPASAVTAKVLMVAGGGGGGTADNNNGGGGGGGAGGLVYNAGVSLSGQQTITVGGSAGIGSPGKDTAFSGLITASGGGKAGGSSTGANGYDGGSGGGAFRNGTGGAGTAEQGYAGGTGSQTLDPLYNQGGSGGGGAGGAGVGATSVTDGANGGAGLDYSSVFGTTYGDSGWFASGGAGGHHAGGSPGTASNGGGGNGGSGSGSAGVNGQNHTGGGGGGGSVVIGGHSYGGSGIVLIKY